ncbi:MAG: 50S ribosomal protein L19 [Candidatus Gracilibacteria bacterium]
MSQALIQHVQEKSTSLQKKIPTIHAGDRVKVSQKIMETNKDGEPKERIQIFEGLVISMNSGSGADKTFTVRKVLSGVGVEKIFPLHSKAISKIEVVGQSKIRRAKLYFMGGLSGKSTRLKESTRKQEIPEELLAEAVEAAKKKEEAEAATAEAAVEVAPETEVEKAAE